MNKIIIICLVSMVFFGTIQAQTHAVYGIVTVFDSIPLIGVEVGVKSTNQINFTDSVGRFTAICNNSDRLKFRAQGFYDQKVNISKDVKFVAVNLRFKPGKKQREYAIGYGYVSEMDRSTAISLLENTETDFSNFSNMNDLLSNMGAQVVDGEIILRGFKSLKGSSAALIVVDDVIVENSYLNSISPRQVKTINIIKDGSSSVYGSRGANGVVIIQMKKGGDL